MDTPISFFQIHQRGKKLAELISVLRNDYDASNPYHQALFQLGFRLKDMQERNQFASLAIIPPKEDPKNQPWLTPWQVFTDSKNSSEYELEALQELQKAVTCDHRKR